MPTRFSSTRKKRGHVSAGHGRVGKHRKHPGGRGKAGGLQHHRTNFDKYHPGYFGKVGIRRYHDLRAANTTMNVERLYTLLPENVRADLLSGKVDDSAAPVIDLTANGIFKLLGRGRLPKAPIVVKARFVSRFAERKIKAAGGVVMLDA